jgi:hypothetical protein
MPCKIKHGTNHHIMHDEESNIIFIRNDTIIGT